MEMFDNPMKKFSKKLLDESGCRIHTIEDVDLRTNRFITMRSSSYIPLQKEMPFKHAVINPQENESSGFSYSVFANQELEEKNVRRGSLFIRIDPIGMVNQKHACLRQ
jgi:hypothetical protein